MPRDLIRTGILAAALVKLLLAALTLGTNDMSFFRHFGWELLQRGLGEEYRTDALFNHTPLVGGYCALITMISAGNERVFAFLIRLPGILADLGVALALLRRFEQLNVERRWLALAFAWSPTALMVSGFHGNVDSVLAACLFFAALAAERRDPLRSGLWLGVACNIKVAALLVTPVFFFHWMARADLRRFFFAAVAVIGSGWLPGLITAPTDFLRQVLGYSGYWGIWGITYLLKLTGRPEFAVIGSEHLPQAEQIVMQILKLSVLGTAVTLAWKHRRGDVWLTLALVWAVFMTFASGVAAQYLVWPMAAVFVVSVRYWVVVEIGNAIFLFVFYTVLCGGLPWYYGEANAVVNEGWLPWSPVAWAGWMACLFLLARRALRLPCLSPVAG